MYFQALTLTLYYEMHGAGQPPFLLLHGTTGRSDSFAPLISHLAPRHQLYIPDLRGHGRSGHQADGYRVIDFAADLRPFIKELIGEPVVLLGHSLGGLVGIALAATAPELVSGLIIEDAPLWLRRATVQAGSERAYNFFKGLHELLAETQDEATLAKLIPERLPQVAAREGPTVAARLAQLDRDVLRMSFDSSLMAGFDIDQSLAQIGCPTLLLQADQASGGSLADEDAMAAVELLAQGSHRFVQGSGHVIHGDRPVEMARLIIDWMADRP